MHKIHVSAYTRNSNFLINKHVLSASACHVLKWNNDCMYQTGKDLRQYLLYNTITGCKLHYENMPMQYTENFLVVKIKIFTGKFLIFFSSPEPKAHR